MFNNWRRTQLAGNLETRIRRGSTERTSRRRFVPRLESLEDRSCPTTLTVGANVNITQMPDTQLNPTTAAYYNTNTSSTDVFAAATQFYGGRVNYATTTSTIPPGYPGGIFTNYSTQSGAPGTWSGYQTIGTGTDSLPAAQGRPRAAYDKFGNLYVAYVTGSILQWGSISSYTYDPNTQTGSITDTSKNWAIGPIHPEWAVGMKVIYGLYQATITRNDGTTVYFSNANGSPATGSTYLIRTVQEQSNTIAVIRSTNDGQSFKWMAFLDTQASTAAPLISVGGTTSLTTSAYIWVYWTSTVAPSGYYGRWEFSSATATSFDTVTGFGTPVGVQSQYIPPRTTGYAFESFAVSPSNQVLTAFQENNNTTQAGYLVASKIYTYVLGSTGVVWAASTWAAPAGYPTNPPFPAMPEYGISAEANLVYDRSGGSNNGDVYLVYTYLPTPPSTNPPPTNTDIYEKVSTNNGSSWSSSPGVKVTDDSTSRSKLLPAAAVDQTTGDLAVIWYDARNDSGNTKVQVYGTVSTNGGASFVSNALIAAPTSAPAAETYTESKSTSNSNGNNTLIDTTQHWTTNWWAPPTLIVQLLITAGTGSGSTVYKITQNSPTQLTVTPNWQNGNPDTSSAYEILSPYSQDLGDYIGVDYTNNKFFTAWADNSNSTGDNPDGPSRALDIYTAAVSVTTTPQPVFMPFLSGRADARTQVTSKLPLAEYLMLAQNDLWNQMSKVAFAGVLYPAEQTTGPATVGSATITGGQTVLSDRVATKLLDANLVDRLFVSTDREVMIAQPDRTMVALGAGTLPDNTRIALDRWVSFID